MKEIPLKVKNVNASLKKKKKIHLIQVIVIKRHKHRVKYQ